MSEVFVARQPIFDARLDVAAYELLFRGSNAIDRALIEDNDEATSTVVINAFTELGLDTVVGDRRAWVNVSRDFVVSRLALRASARPRRARAARGPGRRRRAARRARPAARRRLQGRARRLLLVARSARRCSTHVGHRQGRASEPRPGRRGRGRRAPARLRRHAARREGRDARGLRRAASPLGFELFQGYFFCKPETLSARGVAPNRLTLLQLVAALQDPHIEFGELETADRPRRRAQLPPPALHQLRASSACAARSTRSAARSRCSASRTSSAGRRSRSSPASTRSRAR